MNGIVLARVAALLALGVIGCSGDNRPPARGANAQSATRKIEDSAAGAVDLGGDSYRPGAPNAVGRVTGTITLDGVAPVDTTPITIDQKVCGTKVPPVVEPNAKGLSNTLVWVAGITTGKAMPVERRIGVASEDCLLDPRVQGTVVGAAVNVFNDDRLLHTLVFTRADTHDTLTVMPFFNEGQVVPSERLTKKVGIVEMRCRQHPWTHGYIAVFDHPYYAVTESDGRFTIDSLPPGTYKLMVWHDGASKPVEQSITVSAGGTATANFAIALNGAAGRREAAH